MRLIEYIIGVILLVLTLACQESKTSHAEHKPPTEEVKVESVKEDTTMYYYTACDSISLNESVQVVIKTDTILTIDTLTTLFCNPDNQTPVGYIPFNTSIIVSEEFKAEGNIWLKVKYKDKVGYILKLQEYENTIAYPNVLITNKKEYSGYKWEMKGYRSDNPYKMMSSYDFWWSMVNDPVQRLYSNGLQSTDQVFWYKETGRYYGSVKVVNVNEEGEISLIVESRYDMDWEYNNSYSFYYPVYIKDSLVLVLDADINLVYDESTGEINRGRIYDYPQGLKIPKERLIVKRETRSESIIKNGKVVTDDGTEEGMPLLENTSDIVSFYSWNSDSLILVDEDTLFIK